MTRENKMMDEQGTGMRDYILCSYATEDEAVQV